MSAYDKAYEVARDLISKYQPWKPGDQAVAVCNDGVVIVRMELDYDNDDNPKEAIGMEIIIGKPDVYNVDLEEHKSQ